MPRYFVRWINIAFIVALVGAIAYAPASAGDPGIFGIQMRDNLGEQAALPQASQAGVQSQRYNQHSNQIETQDN